MAEYVYKQFNFGKGLQTKRSEEGRTAPDEFVVFQGGRVSKGGVKRRGGIAKVTTTSTDATALDLDGTDDYVSIPLDTRVHQLPLRWTWEALVRPDVVNVLQYIYGNDAAATDGLKVSISAAGKVVAVVTDTGGTATTLTSSSTFTATNLAIQVKRDLSALTLMVNGVSEATGTMSATLLCRAPTTAITIGRHAGGDYFNGKVDYVRWFDIARSVPTDGWDGKFRWPDPRCSYCMADYTGELDTYNRVLDRSRWGNHSAVTTTTGTPGTTTALALRDARVQAIHSRVNKNGEPEILLIAGGRIHTVGVT